MLATSDAQGKRATNLIVEKTSGCTYGIVKKCTGGDARAYTA